MANTFINLYERINFSNRYNKVLAHLTGERDREIMKARFFLHMEEIQVSQQDQRNYFILLYLFFFVKSSFIPTILVHTHMYI